MQTLIFHLSKVKGSDTHASCPTGEAGSCSPFKSTSICRYYREFQVPPLWSRYRSLSFFFLNYLTWAWCPLQLSSRGMNGNEAVICMRNNRSAEGILLWEEGGGCFNKPWIFILHVWSVLITQLNFQGNSYQASWVPETRYSNQNAKKKKMMLKGIDRQ